MATMTPKRRQIRIDSPLGPLVVEYTSAGLSALRFDPGSEGSPLSDDAFGERISRQLSEYFAGARRAFDLPLAPAGTVFQRRVWEALSRIPFGETRSYAEIAGVVGCPGGSRAVGQANGRNPIPLIVPCHRVVATGGGLGGYSGGIDIKRWLLTHEGWGQAPPRFGAGEATRELRTASHVS